MDFRLSYRGPLKATQRDPKPGSNVKTQQWQLKHKMRLDFHRQLESLWNVHPLLSIKRYEVKSMLNVNELASTYSILPWQFVPLVTPVLQVLCDLEIVLLRLDHPGDSIWSGDIDNRIKTIIDALEVPGPNCGYATEIPVDAAFNPLYCLLSNDKLLTAVSVETDRLLFAPTGADRSWAEVIIRVRIKPENVTMLNLGL